MLLTCIHCTVTLRSIFYSLLTVDKNFRVCFRISLHLMYNLTNDIKSLTKEAMLLFYQIFLIYPEER